MTYMYDNPVEMFAYHTLIPILIVLAFLGLAVILLALASALLLALYDDIRGSK